MDCLQGKFGTAARRTERYPLEFIIDAMPVQTQIECLFWAARCPKQALNDMIL
jgi:hypothetical protein